jgi:hypothetical protein
VWASMIQGLRYRSHTIDGDEKKGDRVSKIAPGSDDGDDRCHRPALSLLQEKVPQRWWNVVIYPVPGVEDVNMLS